MNRPTGLTKANQFTPRNLVSAAQPTGTVTSTGFFLLIVMPSQLALGYRSTSRAAPNPNIQSLKGRVRRVILIASPPAKSILTFKSHYQY
jgi:hypothetical protein